MIRSAIRRGLLPVMLGVAVAISASVVTQPDVYHHGNPELLAAACLLPNYDWVGRVTIPAWVELDWESSNACGYIEQTRVGCANRINNKVYPVSGEVTAVELENRASCPSDHPYVFEMDWRYYPPGGPWTGWLKLWPT